MVFRTFVVLAAAAAALATPGGSLAQTAGELTLYSDIAFRGQSYTVTGPREHINMPFVARSARLSGGESWQVCTGDSYSGQCNTVRDDQGNIAWNVRSARPAQGWTVPGVPGNDQSLRGMAAEFYPYPTTNGRRVASCSNGAAACATQAADRFCRAKGWTLSAYSKQQTINRRIYLADVLCARTRR
ncbi:hypothetical protein B0I00_1788 [Novosphingobium kunmingense]|uniref:Beta/gamma crystallin n=1 Tax=Novosphingobium kunmingense TaxID=1211806 RepID=A0A2N0HKU1_9SPHN|nr:hypothetical protein [Novosphingobium kunmingense]PKB19552.1 hypothetical protein B0I00_1788 [Novosphingobium kunmingense]